MNDHHIFDFPDWEHYNDAYEEGSQQTREACHQLYKKWKEIVFLIKGLVPSFAEETSMVGGLGSTMIRDAYIVGAKIRSSEAVAVYMVRRENAALIRMYAKSITSSLTLFLEDNAIDKDHIQVVKNEIEEFKEIFKYWVSTFEKDDIIDDWGLFI